jgi:membrane protease YdiL (CAAX protease family)
VLFAAIAMPIILGSRVKPWLTGLLVAFLLALPHLGHIMPNPLMPIASVRFSHMVETSTSTFIFGLIIVWLLHRRHYNVKDLFSKKQTGLPNVER